MSDANKVTLRAANAAIKKGDNEGFLSYCSENIVWTTVGESTLSGKAAVRDWMQSSYVDPPDFSVESLVAEGDYVVAIGHITARDERGQLIRNAYSDVWRFDSGKMVELNAFVIPIDSTD